MNEESWKTVKKRASDLTPPNAAELARRRQAQSAAPDPSEIPKWSESQFDRADGVRRQSLAETHTNAKESVSLELDADVVKALRELGPDCQQRVNAVLRAHLLEAAS